MIFTWLGRTKVNLLYFPSKSTLKITPFAVKRNQLTKACTVSGSVHFALPG
jgi:hypothetical protein